MSRDTAVAEPAASAEPIRIDIREAVAEDVPFLYDTWLRSYRDGSRTAKQVNGKLYFDSQRKVIDRIISTPGCSTLVAVNPSDHGQIFGWLCGEALQQSIVLHYGYVKSTFRKHGVFGALVRAFGFKVGVGVFYTHHTHYLEGMLPKPDVYFNPYILMGQP